MTVQMSGGDYLRNCTLVPRICDEGPMFWVCDGEIHARLDGYAIIPIEEYDRLRSVAEP